MFGKKSVRLLILSFVILTLTSLLCLSSCGGEDSTTDTPTTALPENMEAMNYETVYKSKLDGLMPFKVESSDPWVAGANIMSKRNGISVVAYHSGEADLTVYDCFGFAAKLHVTVADDYSIKYNVVSTQMADFYEVQTDGGVSVNANVDVTEKVQAIIDAANPGDTVYFYPGKYKIKELILREGITIKLATTMTDATKGYTDELASQFNSGSDIAVLDGTLVMNNDRRQPGAEGGDNISVIGGALLSRAFVFACADNVRFENLIVKDITESHAYQLTGCTNVTLDNVLFAGYTYKSAFPKEVLQIEHSHPGATGSAESAPLTFKNGEFYRNENIVLDGCYFGKSDKMDPPVIAIGHHGYSGYATITGFVVKNSVFDGCKHSAIRYTNIVDVEITGNRFISSAKYPTVNATGANRPAFIVLWDAGSSLNTFKSVSTGQTVSVPIYQSGSHNINISNNVFDIEGGSDKRILEAATANSRIGAKYAQNIYVAEKFDSRPTKFSGYLDSASVIGNLTFANNTINITGQPTYSNQFFTASNTVGIKIENNTLNLADGVTLSTSSDGNVGFNIRGHKTGAEALSRYIEMVASSSYVSVRDSAGSELFKIKSSAAALLTLASDGNGSITTHCEGGNVIVTVTPNEGYEFDGWYNGDAKQSGDMSISAASTVTAKFRSK